MVLNVDFTSGLSEKLNEIIKIEEQLKKGGGAKIISRECNPLCDICNEHMQTFPLDRIKDHYQQQHNIEGYIKCCNKKLTTDADINQHSLKHLGFDHFSYVLRPICSPRESTISRFERTDIHGLNLKSVLPPGEQIGRCCFYVILSY